jgi:hypothetical protein
MEKIGEPRIHPGKDEVIHVICATKGRSETAEQLLRNLYDDSNCDIIFVVGQNWEEFEALVAVKNELKSNRVSIYFEPYSPSFSYSINAGWGRLRYQLGTDKNILALATTDDHIYHQGWDKAILECYREQFPEQDGLTFFRVIGPTGAGAPTWTGACVASAKFCDLYMGGWLVAPYYHCNGIDTEYAGVSQFHGKREYCSKALSQHLLHDWERIKGSEQRQIGVNAAVDRADRGYVYDILAPWRHWE